MRLHRAMAAAPCGGRRGKGGRIVWLPTIFPACRYIQSLTWSLLDVGSPAVPHPLHLEGFIVDGIEDPASRALDPVEPHVLAVVQAHCASWQMLSSRCVTSVTHPSPPDPPPAAACLFGHGD
jgi:hypothetical protein